MNKAQKHKLPWSVNPLFLNQICVIDSECEDVMDIWVNKKDKEQAQKVDEILTLINSYDDIVSIIKHTYDHIPPELKNTAMKLINVNN